MKFLSRFDWPFFWPEATLIWNIDLDGINRINRILLLSMAISCPSSLPGRSFLVKTGWSCQKNKIIFRSVLYPIKLAAFQASADTWSLQFLTTWCQIKRDKGLKPDKPEIINYKHQITNGSTSSPPWARSKGKFQISITKSQIRSKANCLGFWILVIVICLVFVFCYLKFFLSKPDKPDIINYKQQITNGSTSRSTCSRSWAKSKDSPPWARSKGKFQISITKSQIRSKANCLGFWVLVIVICLVFVFCYLKFFLSKGLTTAIRRIPKRTE